MAIQEEILIAAPVEDVWKVISDIKNSPDFISAIEEIKILEEPDQGLKGLKWEETRTMFGQSAKETMWITDYAENQYYQTRAERPGVVYISRLMLEDQQNTTKLSMGFEAVATRLGTKIVSAITGLIFKKATRNAIKGDLEDIKKHLEEK
jgi:uncharacterized membrane protein